MNHDATHCSDYTPDCPKECYRAELEADLMEKWEKFIGIPISYAHFRVTAECKRGGE